MECVAHPRGPESEWRKALVVLNPDFFILQGVCLAKLAGNVPRQRIDLSPFFTFFTMMVR
jgi:hypothetical protein